MKAANASGFWTRGVRFAVGAVVMTAASLAIAQQAPISVKHAKGETSVPFQPSKTVVFDLASLDTLNALGVKVAGVPGARFPEYLASYSDARYAKVGTLFEPDYEAVKAVSPDLIIVGGRSSAKFPELAKLAPTLDLSVDTADFIGSVERNTRMLAEIYGKQAAADAELSKLHTSLDALRAKAAKSGPGLLVLVVGEKMAAFGPGSRFGMIYDTFGVAPAVEGLSPKERHPITMEAIAKADPQWLFVIDRNAATGRDGTPASKVLDNSLINGTTAARNKQIVFLDPVDWYLMGSAGLTSLQRNIDQISKALD